MPNGDGAFIVAHADGNFYVYEKASREYRETVIRLFLNYMLRSALNIFVSYYNVPFFFPFRTKKVLVILYSLSSRIKLNFLLHMHVTVRYIDMFPRHSKKNIDMFPKLFEIYSCHRLILLNMLSSDLLICFYLVSEVFLESFSTLAGCVKTY